MNAFPRALFISIFVLFTAACDNGTEPPDEIPDPVAAEFVILSGAGQQGFALMPLPELLVVRAVDADGNPVPNQIVHFSVVSGAGTLTDAAERTGSEGVATATWRLGPHSEDEQRARVVALDEDGDTLAVADFVATSMPRASEVTIIGGYRQSARIGEDLPLVVQSTDAEGNPVEGQRILFVVNPGDGTFSVTEALTDAEGNARSVLTLSRGDLRDRLAWVYAVDAEQDNYVFARSDFVVKTLPGPAARLEVILPDDTLNLGHSISFAVQAADQDGNVIVVADSLVFSSNNDVVTIDSARVVAQSFGDAWITVSIDNLRDSARVAVAPLDFVDVSSNRHHTCALTTAGRGYCWGRNTVAYLGNGSTGGHERTPVPLDTDVRFKSISVGAAGGCALALDDSVYCWGMGVGVPDSLRCSNIECSRSPQLVSGSVKFRSIADRCGLGYDDRAYCYGGGSPVPVMENLRFREVQTTEYTVCGVTLDGRLFCLSQELEQLDNGFNLHSFDVGQNHMCALDAEGRAYCAGFDTWGQLGRGRQQDAFIPMSPVATDLRFSQISVSGPAFNRIGATCALALTGAAYCWGLNFSGGLGTDPDAGRVCYEDAHCVLVPEAVVGGARFTKITRGIEHSCGLATTGVLYCWGANGYYGLPGDASTGNALRPIAVYGQRVQGSL